MTDQLAVRGSHQDGFQTLAGLRGVDGRSRRAVGVYLVGVAAALVLLPALAGATLVLITLSGWLGGATAFAAAAGIGAAATLLVGLGCRRYAYPQTANPSVYEELSAELDELSAQLRTLCPDGETVASIRGGACEEAVTQWQALAERLDEATGSPSPGLGWLLATGYVGGWKRLHRAQEALIEILPTEDVIRGAVDDGMRLSGSPIPQRDALLRNLCSALTTLSPAAARAVVAESRPAGLEAAAGGQDGAAPGLAEREARAMLREIRHTINEFRDDCRAGIVRARNKLAATIVFTGLTTFAFLGLAVANDAPRSAIVAAVTFYLVGGLVGLFRQLHSAADAGRLREEDYDLSTARLINTPLLSGLASVGGVVLTAMLLVVVPAPADTAAQQPTPSGAIPTLTEIFDLDGNASAILIAAIFGFTPALLITRLQAHVDKFKADLQATQPAQRVNADA